MENKKSPFTGKTPKTYEITIGKLPIQFTIRDIANCILLFAALMFYSLTFFIPKFYGMTESYAGAIVFVILALMTIVNVNPIERIIHKDIDFIVLCILAVLVIVNILIVDSGFGCFFVAVNFAIIWYLSSKMKFAKWQIYLFSGLYVLMLLYWFIAVYTWMFADYTSFAMNTNTAATFTVFSMLCAFIFFESLYEKYKLAELFMVIALVKCFQISLYHRSRGAFIMLTMFFIFRFLVPKKMWEKSKYFWTMCVIATFGSLLFVAFYIWLGTTGVNFRMPFFYKDIFSGREAIWLEFWNLFKVKPLTGIGTNVTITSFFEFNVHNAMYNILVIHGVLVFAGTLFLMYRNLYKAHKGISKRPVQCCAMAAVFAVCIESFFDVDMIWANYSLNMLLLLLVMNSNKESADE